MQQDDAGQGELHRRWDAIAAGRIEAPEKDPARSLLFYRAIDTGARATAPPLVGRWLARVEELHDFITATGRSPRHNQAPRNPRLPGELRLLNWVRYQRRAEAGLCEYQRERLNVLPGGFDWFPIEEAWDDHYAGYENFFHLQKRRPSRRSRDRQERSLALWYRNQQARQRHGTLPHHLADRLRALTSLAEKFSDRQASDG
jgi:hypothetical protein